jgi:tRNA pseudouridine38-40 synthase
MQRYFFEIAYNGKSFSGWQRQPNAISVQEVIEDAFSKLLSGEKVSIVGCGRTDAGVHAQQYFFHVDLPKGYVTDNLVFKLNRMLSDAVVIHQMIEVSNDVHARFSAKSRTYRYFIHQKKDPFKNDFSWYNPQLLDLHKMNEAALIFLGKKDFTSFSKVHTDVKTNICEVFQAQWVTEADGMLYFEISANRFLRNMVRAVVGTLIDVGAGKIEADDIKSILAQKDRGAASLSVPACGLFLWEIDYDFN